jgi:hypothetical protein
VPPAVQQLDIDRVFSREQVIVSLRRRKSSASSRKRRSDNEHLTYDFAFHNALVVVRIETSVD